MDTSSAKNFLRPKAFFLPIPLYQIGQLLDPVRAFLCKKTLAIRPLIGYTMDNHRTRGILMDLCHAHSFAFSFGWTRFTGFGYFGVEKQRVL